MFQHVKRDDRIEFFFLNLSMRACKFNVKPSPLRLPPRKFFALAFNIKISDRMASLSDRESEISDARSVIEHAAMRKIDHVKREYNMLVCEMILREIVYIVLRVRAVPSLYRLLALRILFAPIGGEFPGA